MTDTIDLNAVKGCPVYTLVELLLEIGQTDRVITMSTQEGNIAIYNVTDGTIVYHGYIDIKEGVMVVEEDNEK